jgi:hypothetical protein
MGGGLSISYRENNVFLDFFSKKWHIIDIVQEITPGEKIMDERSRRLTEQARRWLASPRGQESIKKSVNEAKESSRRFKESRQIDPKVLKESFTI